MPRIFVLDAVEQLRAIEGGLVAQGDVRVFVGDFEERFADGSPVGFGEPGQFLDDLGRAHAGNLIVAAEVVIRQIHSRINPWLIDASSSAGRAARRGARRQSPRCHELPGR